MERGYVKLWRKTLDNGLLQHPTALQLFTYLLLSASRKRRTVVVNGVSVELIPGEAVFTRVRIANELAITEKQARSALEKLKNMQIVATKGANKYTIVSLVNLETYQEQGPAKGPTEGPTEGQQRANKGPTEASASSNINKKERKKEIKENSFCADLSDDRSTREKEAEEIPPLSPAISLPLNTGEEHPVLQGEIEQWQDLYPGVDVMQQLRNMRGWLEANPSRRKTKRGIKRFIHHWLADKQDRGIGNARASPGKPSAPTVYQERMKQQVDMAVMLHDIKKARILEAKNATNTVIGDNSGKTAGSKPRLPGGELPRDAGNAG